ncbi:hypothetical protein DFH11DRAFT_1651292 [Phellopilus nigrolimitatus]|nr:hypothetical protein DFH11DRAFT_1651292 [Phellopilus nigrolimitatus]
MVETADTVLLHTDEAIIRVLQDVLKNMSMNGGSSSADQIWCEVDKENALCFSQSKQIDRAIIDARKRLKTTMEISHALKFLANTIEEKALAFKDQIGRTALKHGIDSLPDELLLYLLSLSASCFTKLQDLSQVCKRFRRVLLASPRLWANCELSTTWHFQQIFTCISRSQGLGLRVHFDSSYLPFTKADLTPLQKNDTHGLLSYAHRWEELYISDPLELEVHQKLHLPALRKISLDCGLEQSSIEYISGWKMPNLEQVTTSNAYLMPVFGQSLLDCRISFTRRFLSDTEICNFLGKYPSLRKLNLLITSSNINGDYSTHSMPVVLSKVDSLFVYVDAEMTALLKVVAFLNGRLSLENLSTMTISVVFDRYRDVKYERLNQNGWPGHGWGGLEDVDPSQNKWNERDWMDGLQRFMAKHRYLKDICFRAGPCLGEKIRTKLAFASLLSCPRLESITIAAPGCLLDFEGVLNYEAYNLRTLRFQNCNLLEPSCLRELQKDLLSIGTELKEIEVSDCPLIDRKTLVEIFPKSKVYFNSWL